MPNTRLIHLAIFLGCAGLLAFGYYLEHGEGLEPCPLCLIQRFFFALVGATALLAFLHHPARFGTIVYASLAELFAIGGAITAGRQIWLQNLPKDQVPECGPGLEYLLDSYPLGDVVAKVFRGSGECAEIGWSLFGLSIAAWALVGFVLLAALSLAVAVRHATAHQAPRRLV